MTQTYGRPFSVLDWTDVLMAAMPATLNELAMRSGRPKGTVKHWMEKLRAARWVHVGDWKRSPGPGKKQPVFKAGQGRDRLEPPNITRKDSVDRSRAKAVKDGRYDFQLAKQRAAKKAARVRKSGRTATPWDALMR